MQKILISILAVMFAAGAADAAPAKAPAKKPVAKTTYSYPQKAPAKRAAPAKAPARAAAKNESNSDSGAYFAFGVAKGFAAWENKYTTDFVNDAGDLEKISLTEDFDYSPFALSGSFGLFDGNFRGELEFNYVFPYSDKVNVSNAEVASYESLDFGSYSFMLNGFFDLGDRSWALRPYIGLGVGLDVATIEHGMAATDVPTGTSSTIKKESHSSSRVSGQGMLGAYGKVGNGVYLDLGYRIVINGAAEITENVALAGPGVEPGLTSKLETEYKSDPAHYVRLGIRFDI